MTFSNIPERINRLEEVANNLREITKVPVDMLRPVMPKNRITRLPIRTASKLCNATDLLQRYSSAYAVVTDRLHVAMPCLAAGTPVLFVHPNLDDPRFGGLIDHVQAITPADFLAGRFDFNFENPPPNAVSWCPIASRLRTRCEEFVQESGLPHKAVPVSKLESGAHLPASELAEAERKLGQTLAARSFLEPVGDSRETSAA